VRTIHIVWPPFSKNAWTASARSEFGVKPPNVSTNSSKLVTSTAWPTGPRSVTPTAPTTAVGSAGTFRMRGSSSTMTTLDARSWEPTAYSSLRVRGGRVRDGADSSAGAGRGSAS